MKGIVRLMERSGFRARVLLCCLLLTLLLGQPSWGQSALPSTPAEEAPSARATATQDQEPVFIQAERVERRGNLTVATGNVSVEIEGLRLDCQRLTYDPQKGLVTAEKEVIFSWGDSFAASETLTLDVATQEAVLQQVAGKSDGLTAGDRAFEGSMYFWADTLVYTPEKIRLERAVLSTCDLEANSLHYHINSQEVTLYPQEQVVAKNTSITFGDTQLYTVPTLVFPLDQSQQRRQAYFPTPGYNSLDGAFLRNAINYSFDRGNFGTVNFDLYSRSGLGVGVEHFFDLGELGGGNLYYYTQRGSQSERNRFELRANGNFNIDKYTRLGVAYNANRFELPGLVSPFNVASAVNISRYAPGNALVVGANFARSGDNDNRSYRFHYEMDLSDRWSVMTRADLSTATSPITRTNRFHYLGSLRHRGDFFEGDLSYERTGGRNTYFLNRQPELSLRSYPFQVGFLPLTAAASFGVLEESPSLFRTERYRFDLRVPDQIIETGFGNFHAGAGMRQSIYGSGQEQYLLGTRVGWTQDFADALVFRFDYNWQDTQGFTPFQNDLNFRYQVLSGGVEVYQNDLFRVSATGAYDLNYSRAYDVITRFDVNPIPGWGITAAANLDPNSGTWRSVDSGITTQLTEGISLTHWSIYDLLNGRLTYQNFSVNYESHDWIGSVTYRGVQNEIFFQMSLKAFPLRPVKIGPDPGLPILPANITNAFTR